MENTASTTLAVVDPVTRRISGLLREMSTLFTRLDNRDFLARQIRIILDAVREELEEDSHLFDNPSGRLWIINFSRLMEWTATGDATQLPEELWPIAEAIEGRPLFQNSGEVVNSIIEARARDAH